jgi:mono/diheme cytochrome c family protein
MTITSKLAVAASLAVAVALTCPAGARAQDPDVAKGKTIYDGIGACASCHGAAGGGDGVAGGALTPKPRSFQVGDYKYDTDGDGKMGTEADIANIIANGAQKYGGSMFMAGRPDIAEADRKAVAKYILTLKK